jgi:hypothetical protein
MAEDLSKRGGHDRERINVTHDHEMRDWAKKFGVTIERLRSAVRSAGSYDPKKVEQYLKRHVEPKPPGPTAEPS